MNPDEIRTMVGSHRPGRLSLVLSRLLLRPRCPRCRRPWPCPPWEMAETARWRLNEQVLDRWASDRIRANMGAHWRNVATRRLPTTRGAAYRPAPRSPD